MSNSGTTIIFYDIPFAEPGVCWSPFTWRTRYCLNYKGLPYRTEWVEYPDIEALCIKIGAAPTDVQDDGVTPEYTLPVIYDPTTGRAVSDSFDIAVYLDATYPSTPRVMHPGMQGIQTACASYANFQTARVRPFVIPAVFQKLPPGRSQEYFRRTREVTIGCKLEDWTPRGEDGVREWKAFERGLMFVDKPYKRARKETGGRFICGEHPTFADFALAGVLQWCKEGFGPESEEWRDISSWEDRKWETFLNNLEMVAQVQ
ncbi:hypothetical protein BT96DRAFT_958228 [Gymnopus androsaceus JB14]|uniref:Uncharacterized protein n=1 Tax=Gymnopus androsaceus JB14 TaxID=1447944 RepID=A0A6A4HF50_9AGAR|nr:hypothetical protein BT96DRAFT_958228 [Gymnopus androsaceus JB14]